MEIFNDYCLSYWETDMFLHSEELESCFLDDPMSSYYDSSSPEGTTQSSSSPASSNSKNIASERSRRKKLNERLYALRSVVPTITKMDKASIIKDAIEYIQSLHDEEKRLHAEISELESTRSSNGQRFDQFDHHNYNYDREVAAGSKRKRDGYLDSEEMRLISSPIEVIELRVTSMGDKIMVVSLICNKRWDTAVKLCEVFESLKLKILTANINAFSGRLLKTVFVEADEEDKDVLRLRIESAIAALNGSDREITV